MLILSVLKDYVLLAGRNTPYHIICIEKSLHPEKGVLKKQEEKEKYGSSNEGTA